VSTGKVYDSCSYEVGLFLVCSSRPHFRNFLDHQSFKPHHHDKMADDSGVRHCHLTVFCVAGEAAAAGDKHEEKLNKKETELRQVAEHLTHLREEHDSLKTEHQQLISDKVLLTEQLQAEQDLCAETEEVLYLFFC